MNKNIIAEDKWTLVTIDDPLSLSNQSIISMAKYITQVAYN